MDDISKNFTEAAEHTLREDAENYAFIGAVYFETLHALAVCLLAHFPDADAMPKNIEYLAPAELVEEAKAVYASIQSADGEGAERVQMPDRYWPLYLGNAVLTTNNIDKDGMLEGYDNRFIFHEIEERDPTSLLQKIVETGRDYERLLQDYVLEVSTFLFEQMGFESENLTPQHITAAIGMLDDANIEMRGPLVAWLKPAIKTVLEAESMDADATAFFSTALPEKGCKPN